MMQPAVYGQTQPTDGKMWRGGGLNSEEKRSSCVGISLGPVSGWEQGTTEGLGGNGVIEERMSRMFGRICANDEPGV